MKNGKYGSPFSAKAVSKIIWVIAIMIIVVVASVTVTWYYTTTLVPPPEVEPIVFGMTSDFTSFNAEWSRLVKAGIEIWIEEVNARGGILGRPVIARWYDDEAMTEKMVSNNEKLITIDNVDVLIGAPSSLGAAVLSSIAEKYDMTTVSIYWPTTLVRQAEDEPEALRNSFALSSGPTIHPRPMFEFMNSLPAEQRPQTIALVNRDDTYGRDSSLVCKELAEEFGFEIVADIYQPVTMLDLQPIMLQVREANPDVVMGNGFTADAYRRVKAIQELGFIPKCYWENIGPGWPEWPDVLGAGGDYVFGGLPWVENYPAVANQEFVGKVGIKLGQKFVSYGPALGYMSMQIYEQAIIEAGSIDQEKIKDALETLEFDTLMGSFNFENHFGVALMFLVQVQEGELKTIWPMDYRNAEPVIPLPPDWGQ